MQIFWIGMISQQYGPRIYIHHAFPTIHYLDLSIHLYTRNPYYHIYIIYIFSLNTLQIETEGITQNFQKFIFMLQMEVPWSLQQPMLLYKPLESCTSTFTQHSQVKHYFIFIWSWNNFKQNIHSYWILVELMLDLSQCTHNSMVSTRAQW